MEKYCEHREIVCANDRAEYYLFTCSISNASSISSVRIESGRFNMKNGRTYYISLTGSKNEITFKLTSEAKLKCYVSMYIGSETLLVVSATEKNPVHTKKNPVQMLAFGDTMSVGGYQSSDFHYNFRSSLNEENLQKLKQHPNDSLVIICKIKYVDPYFKNRYVLDFPGRQAQSTGGFNNLKKLAASFKNSSKSLQEKVILSDGKETEAVSKAVLCAHSPVFAKMFEKDTKERNENTVTITDIKMAVIKALVSFLYSGKLLKYDFRFLCDLYYAADKYNISELSQLCLSFLLPSISMGNVLQAAKLAFSHNIEQLKSTVMMFIVENIEDLVLTNDWRNLLDNDPAIAVEIMNFYDF